MTGVAYGVTGVANEETGTADPYWTNVDYANGVATPIAPCADLYMAISFDKDGQAYGVTTTSQFGKIDKTDGSFEPISDLAEAGYECAYISSGCMDPKSGRFFFNVCPSDETSWMLEIDPQTGDIVSSFELENSDEITSMFILAPLAEDGAPAAVANAKAIFADGELNGSIDFTMPATLFDGSAASGACNWQVLGNGEEIATGTANYGAEVSAPVELLSSGNYTFTITASNAVGKGPKTNVSMFVGKDTPSDPRNVKAEYADGRFNITWDPVTEGFNNGYVDPAKVTYTVVMYPQVEFIAEDINDCSASVAVAIPAEITTYYFTVVANYEGLSSGVVKSNSISLGNVVPPYTFDFVDQNTLTVFNVVDGNADGKTWIWDTDHVKVTYNSSEPADDWLITPNIEMKKGEMYYVSFVCWSQGDYYQERIEACWGQGQNPDDMKNVLVEPTVICVPTGEKVTLGAYIVPEEDGTYNVGLHGISDADMFYLNVGSISIEAGMNTKAPAKANIEVTPDAEGEMKATITVGTPTVDMAGQPVEGPLSVKVLRDGEFIGEQADIEAGATVTFIDEPTEGGTKTYSAICANAYGEGAEASVKAFIGIPAPGIPQNVNMVETSNPGEVYISWAPITEDFQTLPLNPSKVTYCIMDDSGEIIAKDLTETSFTYQAVPAGEQDFVYFAVYGETSGGKGEAGYSPILPVGTPFDAPITESAVNGELSYPMGTEGTGWGVFTDDYFTDMKSADQDGGFFGCKGAGADAEATLMTSKFNLAPLSAPALSFFAYNIVGDDGAANDANEIVVYATCDDVQTELRDVVMSELPNEGWNKVDINLAEYAGKVVTLQFKAITRVYTYTMLDQIKLYSKCDYNLAAGRISAPAKVNPGEPFNVSFQIENEGSKAAEGYSIDFYRNGELAKTVAAEEALEPGATKTFDIEQTFSPMDPAESVYYAKIVFAADEATDDNESEDVTVLMKLSTLPTPTDLTGEIVGTTNKLAWKAPDLSDAPEQVTETFEDAEAFTPAPDGWTVLDLDGGIVGGFQGITIPNWETGSDLSQWQIISYEGLNSESAGLMGHDDSDKYMGAMFNYDSSKQDEWLISPMLYGGRQTISFYAKSYSVQYGAEEIRVLYSTEGTDPESFVEISEGVIEVPADWTEYSFDLPEGAKYFAINCVSTDHFFLMLDDVTYTRPGNASELGLKGFNVYRDGELLASIDDAATVEYVDAEGGNHEYAVTAVYAKGESAVSNIISFLDGTITGLEAISLDNNRADVYNMQGILIMRNASANDLRNIPAGVYIFGNRKVYVK